MSNVTMISKMDKTIAIYRLDNNYELTVHNVPVAQSVSARYLYSSTSEKCRGCEFEPHLEQFVLLQNR